MPGSEARRRLGLDPRAKVVLFFGNIAPYKGLEHLVAAFESVIKVVPDCRLVVAGRPKGSEQYWATIERDIDRLGLADTSPGVSNTCPTRRRRSTSRPRTCWRCRICMCSRAGYCSLLQLRLARDRIGRGVAERRHRRGSNWLRVPARESSRAGTDDREILRQQTLRGAGRTPQGDSTICPRKVLLGPRYGSHDKAVCGPISRDINARSRVSVASLTVSSVVKGDRGAVA